MELVFTFDEAPGVFELLFFSAVLLYIHTAVTA